MATWALPMATVLPLLVTQYRCHMLSWALDSAWVVTIFGIPFRSQCFITSCYAPRLQGDASCVGKGLALVFSPLRQGLHFTQIYEGVERERREGEGRGEGLYYYEQVILHVHVK